MEPNKTAIERAFELARTGLYLGVSEIKERLRHEGYFTESVTGPALRTQLKILMEAARKTRWKAPSPIPSAETVMAAKNSSAKSPRAGYSTAHG